MIARSACRAGLALAARCIMAGTILLGGAAQAQRLEKPVQDWLKQHRLLLVPDELKVVQQVKSIDLDEFVRIFWARRSPQPPGEANPHRALVEKRGAEADARFSEGGKKGVQTACGQVLMLLGNPDEVIGRELRATFENRP
ncbi:MAG TPA: GWxTD domain-containing protein, partial [Gemmatimonadales bacterium]